MAEAKKATFGLDKNIASALTYLLGWLTGLVFLLVEKNDKEIRFHAFQSIIFFGLLTVLMLIPVFGLVLSPILAIVGLVGWIVLLVKAYQGETFKLPVIGEFAEKQAKK